MLKKAIYTILFLFIFLPLHPSYGQISKDNINNAYQQFVKSGKFPNGIASLTVLDGKTGQPIFTNNASIGLPTASTMKVITSITALDILGPDYTYQTKLAYTGEIDSLGVLHGDIIVIGSGDPTLGSNRYAATKSETILNKWVYKIQQAGITHIDGHVVGDDLYLNGNDVPSTWNWVDMGNYYGAGISGLNWRENKTGITFSPSSVGQPTTISSTSLTGMTVINEVTTGPNGSGDKVYAYSAPYSNIIYLRGTYGRDLKKVIEIAIPDPALELALQLTASLSDAGVVVDSLPTTGKRLLNQGIRLNNPKQELDVHQSPALKNIIHWFNQKSINLYGEAMLKSFGIISHNKSNSEEAATLLSKYWEQKLKIPASELHIHDGSGLSPQNRVTTLAMAKIMHYAQSRPWFADFQKSLPTINGITMKSGTIGGVLGYTGFHTNNAGTPVTFSLLINNYTGSTSAMRQEMFTLLNSLK
ncbi:D-alanyl-D-alanine carboxypeptidase/D-alanyl-D-alanine endopeptidase [Sphingobacterium corticibacterium]|uniref:D-alanyl-D-alanine carboxypeptidase/D-alanyl-D-alanine-endopeptidase n=1 Tax=Sphingobacterium corticibacterium TaxID=2484746 RepID=A0A4Q6XK09_9SPHI|nr:D-alanyl-D-alanine carboxypeptidase/D-alanyl-D-alanine-endopeptidase [Sphingobacterium corticibacterium]RZF59715.1 D-alanyl-D-alanine carboxypeptidase/D-alanyl-D-alanine-endopeptidase [Sphingobacterium corticibacterium]